MPVRYESEIEKAVCKQAKAEGWNVWKLVNLGSRGFPDRWFVKPGPVIVIIEFKVPGKRARKLQVYICELLQQLGFEVHLNIDNYDQGMGILRVQR